MRDYLEARTADGARIPSIGRDASIAFASEKRDPAWADVVEPRVRDYFLRQRGIGSFTVIAIECRSTMCEILAANRNPRATSADVDSWQNVVYAMKREDWYRYARIREPQVEFGEAKDGRVAILTHLVRE